MKNDKVKKMKIKNRNNGLTFGFDRNIKRYC